MALRSWKFTFNGKEISVKAKKDDAERFGRHIRSILSVPSMVREITGIFGVTEGFEKENSYVMQSMFGGSGHSLKDPEGYKADVEAFTAEIPTTFESAVDWMLWSKKAQDLINKHMPVNDRRRTPEQAEAEAKERNEDNRKREEERQAKQAEESRQAESLANQYRHLESMKVSGKSSNAAATANLKTELQRAFPGVLFSVKSDTYSMGSSLRVKWQDGPTGDQVKEYSRKYGTKHFDGMTDSESYTGGVFNDVFGGVGYVFEERDISEALYLEAAASMGLEFTAEDWRTFEREAKDPESRNALESIRVKADETAKIPEITAAPAPEQGNNESGTSGVTVSLNPERSGVEIRFSVKPERETIDRLKGYGFRWSPRGKLWYAKQSDTRIRFAYALAGTEPKGGSESGGVDPLTEQQDREGMAFCPTENEKEVAA